MKLILGKPCFKKDVFRQDKKGWSMHISQYFYQNASKLYATLGKLAHAALDIITRIGIPIYAMHDGEVLEATHDNASSMAGNPTGTNALFIRLVTDKKYDYKGGKSYYWTTYVHLSELKVRKGDKVVKGQLIGISGNTGYSYNAHTHIALCPVRKSLVWNWYYKQEPLNGFAGYINLVPFMENMFERIQIKGIKDQYVVWNRNEAERIPDAETVKKYIGKIFSIRLEVLTKEQFDALDYNITGIFPSVKLLRIFKEIAPDILLENTE